MSIHSYLLLKVWYCVRFGEGSFSLDGSGYPEGVGEPLQLSKVDHKQCASKSCNHEKAKSAKMDYLQIHKCEIRNMSCMSNPWNIDHLVPHLLYIYG